MTGMGYGGGSVSTSLSSKDMMLAGIQQKDKSCKSR